MPTPPPAEQPDPAEAIPTPADLASRRTPTPDPGSGADASAATAGVADPEPETPAPAARPPSGDTERGLRGLVGSGSSQVSVQSAARARDASRPTDEDLERAERELTLVRRNWVPREPFRPGRRR